MKTINALCMTAILVVVAFSGCTEKQTADDLSEQAKPAAEVAGLGLQNTDNTSFLDDFNSVNDPYKKTLFSTGQGQRNESINNYENMTGALTAFQEKYEDYRPSEIEADKQFSSDMTNASAIISGVKDDVRTGNLTKAHTSLEGVRPIFQKILTRNNLLPLSVALVDFHDVMENVLDAANDKDAAKVLEFYPRADEKLRAVEAISSDPGIKVIRSNLDGIENLAKENKMDELPAKAADLKASYVKVYLATG
jgi:soluble cytochrome b562